MTTISSEGLGRQLVEAIEDAIGLIVVSNSTYALIVSSGAGTGTGYTDLGRNRS
jgi:hypothetical protein